MNARARLLPALQGAVAWLCVAFAAPSHAADAPVSGSGAASLAPEHALSISQAAIGNRLGDYTFRDSRGGSIGLAQLRGKPLLISFVYTGCFQVCPTTTRTLGRAVEAAMGVLGTDAFNVASVGFNQPFDGPDAMRAFASQQGIHLPNWHFLSPDADTLRRLVADVGFRYAPVTGGFDHVTQVTVVDARGVVAAQLYGERLSLSALVEAIEMAARGERAAPEDALGLLERIRILCTYYDPVSGQYRFKYAIALELAGGLTGIVLLALFVGQRWRAARRTLNSG